jgi:N-acetylglucosaminyldiphosphoundecaprenol N-acetyl-beta-D-mannosaminyltransferase
MIDRGKGNVLGVLVDALDYEAATAKVLAAARECRPLALTALAVHGVMTGVRDPAHGARLNSFDVVTPDGQPVRWALNSLYRAALTDRVYGPTLTARVLAAAAAERLPLYLYGSTAPTLDRLTAALRRGFPSLPIAGAEPSRFRDARPGEAREIAARIRRSGARMVLVGLGCPRQELFVYAMRPLVDAPMLAVGAAFDYHAGLMRRPPVWVQRRGLEWLWRLGLEPRRLWRRYVLLNPAYLTRLAGQKARLWDATPPPPARESLDTFPV